MKAVNTKDILELEALRERRPPWTRQIIALILPTVKMLNLGCERLPTPLNLKGSGSLPSPIYIWVCYHYYGVCFAHLLILQYPDHHQNLISSSLYYSGPVHKISSRSVHNFLSYVVHRQTDKQTDKLTNATKNITSFAKEVIKESICSGMGQQTVHNLCFQVYKSKVHSIHVMNSINILLML